MADEFDLKPTSRGEEFLDVILRSLGGDTPDIPQPAWRYEEYLAAIANAIQNGGGGGSSGGVLVVNIDEEYTTLDKTWQEIHDALAQGIPCVSVYTEDDDVEQGQIVSASAGAGKYFVTALSAQGTTPVVVKWTATSADGYPEYGS